MRKDLLNDYKNALHRYLVVIEGRKKGRFFTIYNGELENRGETIIDDDVPQKIKQEGTREGKIDRHIRDHLHHHLKHVGQEAFKFTKQYKHDIDGVVVGGHQELIKSIENTLPSELKQKVTDTFITDVDLPIEQVAKKVKLELKL